MKVRSVYWKVKVEVYNANVCIYKMTSCFMNELILIVFSLGKTEIGYKIIYVHKRIVSCLQFSSVQSLSRVQLFATPWIVARQASLSITNSRSSLKLMSIESVMPSSPLILCRPLLLLLPIPPSIRSFPMSQLFTWGGQSIGVSA